ncbi:Spindle pole body interacting protein [Mycena kentingensis (nom. inval.)]|nr:Spindle pole body interacting protein [Mycena kentingensis (nom. inval.)]
MPSTTHEPLFGELTSTIDAMRLALAGRENIIPRVTRRLTEKERNSSIKSGAIFVFDPTESGFHRWIGYKNTAFRWSAVEKGVFPGEDLRPPPDSQTITVHHADGGETHIVAYYTRADCLSGVLPNVAAHPDPDKIYVDPRVFLRNSFRMRMTTQFDREGKLRFTDDTPYIGWLGQPVPSVQHKESGRRIYPDTPCNDRASGEDAEQASQGEKRELVLRWRLTTAHPEETAAIEEDLGTPSDVQILGEQSSMVPVSPVGEATQSELPGLTSDSLDSDQAVRCPTPRCAQHKIKSGIAEELGKQLHIASPTKIDTGRAAGSCLGRGPNKKLRRNQNNAETNLTSDDAGAISGMSLARFRFIDPAGSTVMEDDFDSARLDRTIQSTDNDDTVVAMGSSTDHCSFVILAEFDILQAAQLKFPFPQPLGAKETFLAMARLPDGADTPLDDWTVFFLNQTPFNTISPVLALDTPEMWTSALRDSTLERHSAAPGARSRNTQAPSLHPSPSYL